MGKSRCCPPPQQTAASNDDPPPNYFEAMEIITKAENNHQPTSVKPEKLLSAPRCHTAVEQKSSFTSEMVKALAESWRTTLKEYCQLSTLHGISDFYNAENQFLRFFWLVLILAGLGAALYGCVAIISQYMAIPLGTLYVVQEANVRYLPDIIVCPFNRFNQSFLNSSEIDTEIIEYVQVAFGMGTPYKFQKEKAKKIREQSDHYAEKLDALLSDLNMTFLEFIEAASFECSSFVRYCATQATGYSNCCHYAEKVLMTVGMCFRLKGVEQIHSGFGYGITIIIRLPDRKFLSPGINNLHNDGVAIKLAEPGKGIDYTLTYVPSGVHALMPLRATKFEFINDPPRYECLMANASYSPIRCFDTCFFNDAANACKCRHMATMATQDVGFPPCKPAQLSGCLRDQMLQLFNVSPNIILDCRMMCKPPCIYWEYQPIVSYTKFPSAALYKYVPVDEQQHWDRFIVLDVFYETLEYSIVRHVPTMTPDTFIANIGGQLGLWVGGSVLTVVQFLLFIGKTLWHQIAKARTRTRGIYVRLMASTTFFAELNKVSLKKRNRPPRTRTLDNVTSHQ